jgi:hypothetical protein
VKGLRGCSNGAVMHAYNPSTWEDLEFKVSLGYIVNSRPACLCGETLSQKKKKIKRACFGVRLNSVTA